MKRMLSIACSLIIVVSGMFYFSYSQFTDAYFDTVSVDDFRKEARCQNFADFGAAYKFKIIDGKAYYSRNGKFMGEFKNKDSATTNFWDHTTKRNFKMPAPYLTMISARNNRVIAHAGSGANFQIFWACIVQEFDHDYRMHGYRS